VQCLHRWNKILKPGLIKGPWTIEEDRKLLEWVKINGPIKWTSCSEFICGRSGKQCRERWFNTLNPNVKKGGWTPEEDFLIFKFFSEFGSKWSLIASKFPGRTENSVKNRFYSTLRRISLDKKKNIFNDKKTVDALNNNSNLIINNLNLNVNNNNLNLNINNNNFNNNNNTYFSETESNINNEAINNRKNNENSNLNLSSLNNPSSSLEELMKYLPQAFAEKSKIYLQFKKNEEKFTENLNINIDNKHELNKFDFFNLGKNEDLSRILENKDGNKFKNSFNSISKKDLKLFEDSNHLSNRKLFSTNETKEFGIPKKNFFSTKGNINEFIECDDQGNLNQTHKTNTNFNQLNVNFSEKLNEKEYLKNIGNDFLQRKRTKDQNEVNPLVENQEINTFNIKLKKNQRNFENAINCNKAIRKSKKIINENIENESNQKIKKLDLQKYSKIEDLEKMIENFNEISSKTESLEKVSEKENKNKKSNRKRKIRKNQPKTDALEKLTKNSVSTNTDKLNLSLSENNVKSVSSSNSNSDEDKKCLFKVPEICSNEEITKLSLNLMHRNEANQISFCKNSQNLPENYLYLENEKIEKKGKSKKLEKEEIFKFDALNDLYDQLNNLESILLNTREQLFNLDRIFYYNNTKSNFEFNLKKENYNKNLPEPKNLELINSEFLRTHNSVNEDSQLNSISNSNEKDKTKNHQVIFKTENDNKKSLKKNNQIKNNNLKKEIEPFAKKEIKESNTINEEIIKNGNTNEEIITAKTNKIFNLPNVDKNLLFFQDDLHFINIGEMNNIKLELNNKKDCSNNNKNLMNNSNSNIMVFNSNSLLNNFEGQLNEEQSYPYMDNMFQI